MKQFLLYSRGEKSRVGEVQVRRDVMRGGGGSFYSIMYSRGDKSMVGEVRGDVIRGRWIIL